MAKKFSLLLAAVAVLAFAIPPMAGAAEVTDGAGVTAKTGTNVTGTSTNASVSTSLGPIQREELAVKGTLTEKSKGGSASGTIAMTFVLELPNSVMCHLRTASSGLTYVSGLSAIKLTNADLVATPAACEPGTFNADVATTKTIGGTVLILDGPPVVA